MSFNNEIKGIRAAMIFDIIGRPQEYLVETLNKVVDEIDKEKGVRVVNKKISEPVVMKDNENFFTDFAEVEVEVEEIRYLVMLMFKYMPASIEVISPENIPLSNTNWTDVLTEVTRRLHGYDEIARIMQTEKGILENKLKELLKAKEPVKEEKEEKKTKSKKSKKE